MTFKEAIYKVLMESGKPLYYREIAKRALAKGWLKTKGKTPIATVGAQLAVDIKTKGSSSKFKRVAPGIFGLRDWKELPAEEPDSPDWQISPRLSPKQKGDIAEARVAELIQLYGEETLSCYKPISDDEGIDLIVKRKGSSLQSQYIQVKSRFKLSSKHTYIVSLAKDAVPKNYRMSFIFVYFDLQQGDIGDHVWFIPAPDFIKYATPIPANPSLRRKAMLRFTASTRNPTEGKWGEYAVDKRALADAIVELMEKVK
ncbi:MAG: HTH domain-containing protein [Candidatus Neomarinimicrobiota bacterium]